MTAELPDHLILRSVQDQDDRERFAAFNAAYNNPYEGATSTCLLNHHPSREEGYFWLVEDERSQQIVSTTCLIPWECRYAGIVLKAAQLEMALTHPDNRGRGLVRVQMKRFHQVVEERQFDLCIIWGIPYYYRQYGYGYALDGETLETLPEWRIRETYLAEKPACHLRPANVDDIPFLCQCYDQAVAGLDFYVARSPEYWRYLLEAARYPVYILTESQALKKLGYAVIKHEQDTLVVLESGFVSTETASSLLQVLKDQNEKQVSIAWPEHGALAQLARSLGSQMARGGQWLLRIPDVGRFLMRIGPALENRLASSDWRGLIMDLVINLFRQAYQLHFKQPVSATFGHPARVFSQPVRLWQAFSKKFGIRLSKTARRC